MLWDSGVLSLWKMWRMSTALTDSCQPWKKQSRTHARPRRPPPRFLCVWPVVLSHVTDHGRCADLLWMVLKTPVPFESLGPDYLAEFG